MTQGFFVDAADVSALALVLAAVLAAVADCVWATTNAGAHNATAIATARVLNEKQGRFLIVTSSTYLLVCLLDP
jgi:hypothetical protein